MRLCRLQHGVGVRTQCTHVLSHGRHWPKTFCQGGNMTKGEKSKVVFEDFGNETNKYLKAFRLVYTDMSELLKEA